MGVLIALDSCLGAYSVGHGEVTGPTLTTIGQPLLGFPGVDFSTSRHRQRTSQASPGEQSSSAGGAAQSTSRTLSTPRPALDEVACVSFAGICKWLN